MIESQIARRYAKALVDVCDAQGTLQKTQDEMRFLADMLVPERGDISVPELLTMLYGPRIPKTDKFKLADLLAEKFGLGEAVCALLKTLIRRNRITLISPIETIFHELASLRRSVTPALVESATPLSDAERSRVHAALVSVVGGEVELEAKVQEKLLGGMRVRVRNVQVDGSVAGALERLEQRFAKI